MEQHKNKKKNTIVLINFLLCISYILFICLNANNRSIPILKETYDLIGFYVLFIANIIAIFWLLIRKKQHYQARIHSHVAACLMIVAIGGLSVFVGTAWFCFKVLSII
jgi:hypothetical protein